MRPDLEEVVSESVGPDDFVREVESLVPRIVLCEETRFGLG